MYKLRAHLVSYSYTTCSILGLSHLASGNVEILLLGRRKSIRVATSILHSLCHLLPRDLVERVLRGKYEPVANATAVQAQPLLLCTMINDIAQQVDLELVRTSQSVLELSTYISVFPDWLPHSPIFALCQGPISSPESRLSFCEAILLLDLSV